jgi:hypothetical protein
MADFSPSAATPRPLILLAPAKRRRLEATDRQANCGCPTVVRCLICMYGVGTELMQDRRYPPASYKVVKPPTLLMRQPINETL